MEETGTNLHLGLIRKPRVLFEGLKSDPIVRNSAIYLSGSLLAGFLGYVFHFETGHLLGPSSYAVVASAIAALYVLTLPGVGLQLLSARYAGVAAATGRRHAIGPLLFRLTAFTLVCTLPLAGLLAVFSNQVSRFLNVSDHRVVYVLAVASLIAFAVAISRGALQGLRRFVALSGNMFVDTVMRLIVAAMFIWTGFGALGAIAAVAIGPAVAYAQSLVLLRHPRPAGAAAEKMAGLGGYAVLATVAGMGTTYLLSVDTLLAKHFLAAGAAGIYAATSVLARVAYFLGLSVAGVMFPEVATLHARNQTHFHVVDRSLLLVGAMSVALMAVYALLPDLVLFPYGSGFKDARSYLPVFALALSMLAIANLLISYFLSIARTSFIGPLFAACVIETALIVLVHRGIWQIVSMVVLTQALLCMAMVGLYIADRRVASARER